MKKSEWYVPNLPEYEHNRYDLEGMRGAYARFRKRMMPTSIALPPETIADLKFLAMKRGVPYQVLMRSFVLQGLKDSIVAESSQTPSYRVGRRKKKK